MHEGASQPELQLELARPLAFTHRLACVSRSSLNRGFYAPDVPLTITPNIPLERQENAMEQYGNTTTFNLENVLRQNIMVSTYYKQSAAPLESVHDLIDEIYYSVEHVEPWMSGNARGPSTAFNLLFRLAQLRPTSNEIRTMLDHADSPYIRAIGFLYLRYTCNPRTLWDWFKKYVDDGEEFTPSPQGLGRTITLGAFVRDILLDQYYFETIFPRIPTRVAEEVEAELKSRGFATRAVGNAGQGGEDRRGVTESAARPASVKQSLSVALGQRAPNRASVRELGRGTGADLQLERTVQRRERGTSADDRRERNDDRQARNDDRGDERRRRENEGRELQAERRASRPDDSDRDAKRWREDPARNRGDDRRRQGGGSDACRDGEQRRGDAYARDDGRGYSRGDGRGYSRDDGRGYSRDDGRGYSRDDTRGYSRDDTRGYSRDDTRGYSRNDGRGYNRNDARGQGSRRATDERREPDRDERNGRSTSDVFKERPASDVFKERPASDVFKERPAAYRP